MAITGVQVFTQPQLHLQPRRCLRALSTNPAKRLDPSVERCFASMHKLRRRAMALGCAAAALVILFFPPTTIRRVHEEADHWKARVADNACAARHAFACRSLDGRAHVCAYWLIYSHCETDQPSFFRRPMLPMTLTLQLLN